MKAKVYRYTVALGLTLVVGLSSCGKKKQPVSAASANKATKPAAEPATVPVWISIENPVEPAMAYSDHLLSVGDYARAVTLLNGLQVQYPELVLPEDLQQRVALAKKAGEIEPALIPKLSGIAEEKAESIVALNESKDAGLVVLRHQVLESKNEALCGGIVDYLVSKDNIDSLPAIMQRWKRGASEALSPKLISAMGTFFKKHSQAHDKLNTQFLENTLLYLAAARKEEQRQELRAALGNWNFKDIDKATRLAFRDRLLADKSYAELHLMEFMALVFQKHCAKDPARFDAYIGTPSHDKLVSYLTPAVSHSAKTIATIAREIGPGFGLPDMNALKNEMALYYKFNESANAIKIYDTRSRKVGSKLHDGLAAKSILPGLEGNGIYFRGQEKLTLSKYSIFREKERNQVASVGKNDYTLSVWIKPEKIPMESESRQSLFAIVCREAQPVGVFLNRKKQVVFVHPFERDRTCKITSNTIVPIGKWTHVLAVFNRSGGNASLYINSELAGQASFPANARPENSFIVKRFMLGAPGSYDLGFGGAGATAPKYMDYAFIGMMDELRIYARALAPAEIKQIYQIHASLAE